MQYQPGAIKKVGRTKTFYCSNAARLNVSVLHRWKKKVDISFIMCILYIWYIDLMKGGDYHKSLASKTRANNYKGLSG